MHRTTDSWVIVLAAGSGSRLAELTTDRHGVVVPKQFCSLRGGRSLLLDAIDRALRLAPRERVVAVVAAEHERWWRPQLACLPAANVVVQPENRGTTAGLALPLATVLARDPEANVAVLPSDHFVRRPDVLTRVMQSALAHSAAHADQVVLLGIEPDGPDTEYGWIVPAGDGGVGEARPRDVFAFVEKPPLPRAAALLQGGAVWNSFLFAGRAATVHGLCARHAAATVAAIDAAVARPAAERAIALDTVYRSLPTQDFSKVVLHGSASRLRVVMVPECGWTDLGTPRRVADCLAVLERRGTAAPRRRQWFPTVDLSDALAERAAATRLVQTA